MPFHDYQGNWENLRQHISRIRQCLEGFIAGKSNKTLTADSGHYHLGQLSDVFNLSPFERDILVLCVGMELEPDFEVLCAKAQGSPNKKYPTLSLALATLPEAQCNVLSPQNALQKWQLIEFASGLVLTQTPIRINKRILCYLLGESAIDEQLASLFQNISPEVSNSPLPGSHEKLVDQLVSIWSNPTRRYPVLQLSGSEITSQYKIAAATCEKLGLSLRVVSAELLPTQLADLSLLRQSWEREAFLSNSALLLDCNHLVSDPARLNPVSQFVESIMTPIVISSPDRLRTRQRLVMNFDLPPLDYQEQKAIWESYLEVKNPEMEQTINLLASQFNLSPATIQSACVQFKNDYSQSNRSVQPTEVHYQLWNYCRVQSRPQLEELAQRIETKATWEDLVLPDRQKKTLQEIVVHLQQRRKVYEEWGFAQKEKRGLGISALFGGQSGTGKTMAASVLARELNLDLYRVDLSAVVSKYIGETEKNLRRIFDGAEMGGSILLFDEADALFGKRTEVKDSHDRHANVEVSYLLQRMEAYQGLAILTTNLKEALDKAFMRRIRFALSFPFPDAEARAKIWQRIFPTQTPTFELNYEKLARLSVAGGNIRNIALNAAVLAANSDEPVMMKHILQAAQTEFLKLEKMLSDADVRDWT